MTIITNDKTKDSQLITDLQAAGVDDFVADGALHQRQAELLLLRVHGVLLPRLATRKTHRRVRQDRLQGDRERERQASQTGTSTAAAERERDRERQRERDR